MLPEHDPDFSKVPLFSRDQNRYDNTYQDIDLEVNHLANKAASFFRNTIKKSKITNPASMKVISLFFAYFWVDNEIDTKNLIRNLNTRIKKAIGPGLVLESSYTLSDLIEKKDSFRSKLPVQDSMPVSVFVEFASDFYKACSNRADSNINEYFFKSHFSLDRYKHMKLHKLRCDITDPAFKKKDPTSDIAVYFLPESTVAAGDTQNWKFFSYENKFVHRILSRSYNQQIVVRLINSIDDVNNFFSSLAPSQKVAYVEFQGHGNSDGIYYRNFSCKESKSKTHTYNDPDDDTNSWGCVGTGLTIDSVDNIDFHGHLVKGGEFYLNSCETGKGSKNVAKKLSLHQEVSQHEILVSAPTIRVREKFMLLTHNNLPLPNNATSSYHAKNISHYVKGTEVSKTNKVVLTPENIRSLDFFDNTTKKMYL